MSYINSLRQRISLITITFALVCVAVAGVGMWRVAGKNDSKPGNYTKEDTKQNLQKRARASVGSQVHFAASNDSTEQVDASVASVANFIYERADVVMSVDSKMRVAQAERNVLEGKGRRLGIAELIDVFTDITLERLTRLTDGEIEWAANTYSATPDGEISSRDSGKWGYLTKEEFSNQLKAGREWAERGDFAVRSAVKPLIEGEVKERVEYLSESLPEQFGRVAADGFTPAQAVLLAYSVAADDHLLGSQSELEQEKILRRIAAKQTRNDKKIQGKRESGKPYGVGGYLHSSPIYLFFNQNAVDTLISRMEGGKK